MWVEIHNDSLQVLTVFQNFFLGERSEICVRPELEMEGSKEEQKCVVQVLVGEGA